MAYEKKLWQDRISAYPGRRTLTPTGEENTYDVTRAEGNITAVGDAFSAENMNGLEERIEAALTELTESDAAKLPLAQKGSKNGVASLDGNGKVPSSQLPVTPANRVTAGTLGGTVQAQNNAAYTTRQVRNITLSTAGPSGGGNGDVWITYQE